MSAIILSFFPAAPDRGLAVSRAFSQAVAALVGENSLLQDTCLRARG